MSAQPSDAGPGTRHEPTIRSVRAALPEDQRPLFQAEIERTPLHRIAEILKVWDIRARAYASPKLMAAVRELDEERAGTRAPARLLTEDEIREVLPALRP